MVTVVGLELSADELKEELRWSNWHNLATNQVLYKLKIENLQLEMFNLAYILIHIMSSPARDD